ncbi:hypothetical protein [Phytohabitans aurantiacus]|uniref:Serpin domain-containing protein n=1 Tax=Phytohabitans aurantiacus TaxID=3016789 RepID=A0ABQ5R8L9_9ACTN|nr:hypothetical protein [Phytohabitans aurantiacus]GLI02482.1 hypothetical protein Pa4123_77600 [Phytohabitans aurantiacus]
MPVTAAETFTPIARYAARLHAIAGGTHHVASPLGAWLLLALCGAAGHDVEEALGVDADDALAFAADLLGTPHDAVLSAAAVWTRARADALLRRLPAAVETGDLPGQDRLDAWAREHTLGLIESFPLQVPPTAVVVLATALATKVSWGMPFDVVPGSTLGGPFGARLANALRTPEGHGHRQFVASSARAGDLVVHTARAREGLAVTSVAAAPDVPAADVLAAAYEVAGGTAVARSLFDLPLGDGPLWTISERHAPVTAASGREERCAAILPAWEARSEIDLGHPDLGFPAGARAIAELLGLTEYDYEARQSAVARYTRVGFEAAAVSAMFTTTGFTMPREGLVRTAELRFGHPYAVVAVASGGGPWDGVPVFSAWVANPSGSAG